ncbi:MAG: SPFH domain-containing protein [Candidatus Cloacimonetes bacterium]|nr:SPFH domain-containing protein [Candidatus Cloacimonadota bacterium]
MKSEVTANSFSGWLILGVLVLMGIMSLVGMFAFEPFVGSLIFVAGIIMLAGFFTIEPGESRVLTMFGKYVGTVREPGFHWVNPLILPASCKRLSLRIRNFHGDAIKVNDCKGNPVEISAVVVWEVQNTAQAAFGVDHYERYVEIQTDAALRHIASLYPYDDESAPSLRGSQEEISASLQAELTERFLNAGVKVLEVRISHLAYAPEIAATMLRRQQAEAVIQARRKIVEGAVGMVEMALSELSSKGVVDLDSERKAAMVQNLMVVLCSDRDAQPVINAGTMYH